MCVFVLPFFVLTKKCAIILTGFVLFNWLCT